MSYQVGGATLAQALAAARRMRRPRGLGDTNPCPSTAPYFCSDPRSSAGACCPVSDCSVCVGPPPATGAEVCIDYDTAWAAAGVGTSPCQPRDQACITARDSAVAQFQTWWNSTPGNCHALSEVPKFAGPSTIPPVTSSSSSNSGGGGSVRYSPQLSFATSASNAATPKVGDSWSITITGGPPNTSVTATARGSTTTMGQTDAGGTFRLSGTFDASTVGAWTESWAVGTQLAGTVSFTVQAVGSSNAPDASKVGGGTSSSNSGGASVAFPSWFTETSIDGIPNWGLLAAGLVVAGMFFFGGRR